MKSTEDFCETMTKNSPNLIKNMSFNDECTFWNHWNDENPPIFRGHMQVAEKLIVWAVILDDAIVGPNYIDGTLNGENG